METNYNDSPVEILGLDKEKVKKLKQIFIYTVGQLQAKTEEALKGSWIFQEDSMTIEIISNALVKKTGRGFAKEIEPQDKIENLKLGLRKYRVLKRVGIYRISELMRISKLELKTITGIDDKSCEEIEGRLRENYGEQYDTVKEQMIGKNPDAMSWGHLDISSNLFLHFRNGEIHTVGDYQRKVDIELLSIKGIDEWDIEMLNKQLSRRGINRYKDGKEGIETLNLPERINSVHKENGIQRVDELLEMTWEDVMAMHQFNGESIIRILSEYMKNILLKDGKYNILTELEMSKRIKSVMYAVLQKRELQKKRLKDVVELLRDTSK